MSYFQQLPLRKLGISFVSLAFLVTILSIFWPNNTIVFVMLLLATLAIFLRPRRKKTDIIPFLVGAVLGPAMEMIIIHFGGWQYANSSFGGIPLWLPLLWGLTGFFFLKMTVWLIPRTTTEISQFPDSLL